MDEQQTKQPAAPPPGPRTERAAFWAQVVQEQAGSGLSVRAFCRERQLTEPSFYWWRQRLRGARPRSRGAARGDGRRRQAGAQDARAGFVEVVATPQPPEPAWSGVTLHVDGRLHVVVERGFDVATLRAVLAVVAEAPACSP